MPLNATHIIAFRKAWVNYVNITYTDVAYSQTDIYKGHIICIDLQWSVEELFIKWQMMNGHDLTISRYFNFISNNFVYIFIITTVLQWSQTFLKIKMSTCWCPLKYSNSISMDILLDISFLSYSSIFQTLSGFFEVYQFTPIS